MEEGVSVTVYTCNHCTCGYKQEDQEPMASFSYMSELRLAGAIWGEVSKISKKYEEEKEAEEKEIEEGSARAWQEGACVD